MKGPLHKFNGYTANFYISTGQGMCSIERKNDAKLDADYFCASFYGAEYKSISYKQGRYEDSGKLGYQMHKATGCADRGEDIKGTDCSGVMCKIMKTADNSLINNGLFNIECSGGQGNS